MISIAQDGNTNLKSIDPRYENQVKQLRQQKSDLLGQPGSPLMGTSEGGVTQTGTSLSDSRADSAAGPSRVLKSSVAQNSENVNNAITRLADLGYDDRVSAIHEISDIKRTTIGSNEPVRRDNFRKNSSSQSPDR